MSNDNLIFCRCFNCGIPWMSAGNWNKRFDNSIQEFQRGYDAGLNAIKNKDHFVESDCEDIHTF